jgi:hypothetical protein
MKSDKTSKRAAAIGLTAGLVGGGAAGLVFGVPGLSTAADDSAGITVAQAEPDTQTGATDPDPDTSPETSEPGMPDAGEERPVAEEVRADATARIRESLQQLVDDNTLTAEQADAVAEHLGSQAGGRGPGMRGDGHGGHGERGERIVDNVETLTGVLGIDAETLRDELRNGSTIAEIAEAQGVAVSDVIDALVTDAQERIDQAVAEGRIDEDRAAEMSADLEERITAHVNGEHPAFGRMRPDAPADDATTSPDAQPSSLT